MGALRRPTSMHWISRAVSSMTCMLGLFAVPAWSAEPVRVALVIGNSTYAAAPHLANPGRDAKLVADALHRAGFSDVDLQVDLTKGNFEKALRAFQAKADGAEVALIYYAGHGLEVDGRNWLVPVDATLADERDLPFQGIDLDMVLGTVTGAKGLRVVVLDACRDNPFTRSIRRVSGTRGLASRGLADIEVTGTLVLYAQRAGQTALDGSGGADSPFATALAARLPERGVDIRLLVSQVRDDVLAATGGKQEPFSYGSLPGVPLELLPATPNSDAPRVDPELQAFNEAATRNTRAAWESYLKAYPAGRYAYLARSQREAIKPAVALAPGTLPQSNDSQQNSKTMELQQSAESTSLQDEQKGDDQMLEALTTEVCLKTKCLNYSAGERQRQDTVAQRGCVMAKRQWRLALNETTSPERAMKLKSKLDSSAIQCRKNVGCSSTGWSAYNYIAPEGGDIQMIPGFHCSETDPL
jgi:Caspase domain